MSILPQKKRKALAVISLVVGFVTLITTVILAISGVIRDFGYQVVKFMQNGENLLEFAITILVSLALIFLPVIAIAMGTVALWKAYKNSSLYGARFIAVVGIILNLLSGPAYLLLLLSDIEPARYTSNVNLTNPATNTGTVNKRPNSIKTPNGRRKSGGRPPPLSAESITTFTGTGKRLPRMTRMIWSIAKVCSS